jgi:hypothetical protein
VTASIWRSHAPKMSSDPSLPLDVRTTILTD